LVQLVLPDLQEFKVQQDLLELPELVQLVPPVPKVLRDHKAQLVQV
jgi:hypothetical protein